MFSRLRRPIQMLVCRQTSTIDPSLFVATRSISTSCTCSAWSSKSPIIKKEQVQPPRDKKTSEGSPKEKRLGPNVTALRDAPKAALYLGAGGLVPFIATPLVMLGSGFYVPMLHEAQVIYGATILSFLGGARWGLAVTPGSGVEPTWKTLGFSVIPPLFAWMTLILSPNLEVKTSALVFGLTLAMFHDSLVPGYTPWFKALRLILTVVATLGLGLSNIATMREKEGLLVKQDLW